MGKTRKKPAAALPSTSSGAAMFTARGPLPPRCPVFGWLAVEGRRLPWLARQMRVNRSTLWRWLQRPAEKRIPDDRVAELATLTGISLEFLNRWFNAQIDKAV